jgi:dipeptide/tripeptide permease
LDLIWKPKILILNFLIWWEKIFELIIYFFAKKCYQGNNKILNLQLLTINQSNLMRFFWSLQTTLNVKILSNCLQKNSFGSHSNDIYRLAGTILFLNKFLNHKCNDWNQNRMIKICMQITWFFWFLSRNRMN